MCCCCCWWQKSTSGWLSGGAASLLELVGIEKSEVEGEKDNTKLERGNLFPVSPLLFPFLFDEICPQIPLLASLELGSLARHSPFAIRLSPFVCQVAVELRTYLNAYLNQQPDAAASASDDDDDDEPR